MFPAKDIRLDFTSALLSLFIILQTILLSYITINYNFFKNDYKKSESRISLIQDSIPLYMYNVTDILKYKNYQKEQQNIQPESKVKNETSFESEKLQMIADKYKVDSDYLEYIIYVEKLFELEPCELLALVAQESGFKPQTRMDGGSISYNTTQMKLATAQTAHMAITEYYKINIPSPTHELLSENKYYATFLAGGYLRYLQDVYKNKEEAYTAYNWGIGGRMNFYKKYGHFRSAYAVKLNDNKVIFQKSIGKEYDLIKEESISSDLNNYFSFKNSNDTISINYT